MHSECLHLQLPQEDGKFFHTCVRNPEEGSWKVPDESTMPPLLLTPPAERMTCAKHAGGHFACPWGALTHSMLVYLFCASACLLERTAQELRGPTSRTDTVLAVTSGMAAWVACLGQHASGHAPLHRPHHAASSTGTTISAHALHPRRYSSKLACGIRRVGDTRRREATVFNVTAVTLELRD